MAPSSLASRPRPPGGLRPALTPAPGDAHQHRPGAGSHNFKSGRFEGIAGYSRTQAFAVLRENGRLVFAMASGSVTGAIIGGLLLGTVPEAVFVACQGDGTTALPGGWDHLVV